MDNLNKNLVLEGIFASEVPDSSGEVLNVSGADIDELKSGKALVNTEHVSAKDLDKASTPDDFKGFQTIIGRVLNAKKIFDENDCQNKRELTAWHKIQKPLIYGQIEIWDGPDAHDNAKAAASIARMLHNANTDYKLGLSVEGQTLKREGNLLKETVIRCIAATLRPCNRTATVDIVKDDSTPSAPTSVMKKAATSGGFEPLFKSVDVNSFNVSYLVDPKQAMMDAYTQLKKALTAGVGNAAPSSLTGGEALKSLSKKIVKAFNKKPTKKDLKKLLKSVKEEHLDIIYKNVTSEFYLQHEDKMNKLYKKFKN